MRKCILTDDVCRDCNPNCEYCEDVEEDDTEQ